MRDIRAQYATGNYSTSQIARQYGVAKYTVWQVVRRVTWKHIGDTQP